MKVEYRQLFLKDLKKLKKQPIYQKVYKLAFETLPDASALQDVSNVKVMVGTPNRYRIRLGNYRVGIEISEDALILSRVLHRQQFYRYFP